MIIAPEKRTILVTGSGSLIIAVGQQLAWLGAACRASNGQSTNCYTTFSEVENLSNEAIGPLFNATYDGLPTVIEDTGSCWHDLVGNAVVAVGFPIPERTTGAVGLSLSLEILGTLAKIPLATRFGGGYVLKGRSIAFVPVDRKENTVQWHMIKKEGGGRLNFRERNCAASACRDYHFKNLMKRTCFPRVAFWDGAQSVPIP